MILFKNGYFYDSVTHSFTDSCLLCDDKGTIVSFPCPEEMIPKNCPTVDLNRQYVIPGLIDVHTHGRFGYDFNSILEERMPDILLDYARAGTAVVFPTLASDRYEMMLGSAMMIRKFYHHTEDYASVAGLHVEGRYLSEEKRGAHDPKLLADPNEMEFNDFQCSFYDAPLHFSLAPERTNAERFIRYAVANGATVGMAHSNASYDFTQKALSWGITSFTHTFNCMHSIHQREPGNAVASLLCDEAYSEFIADGLHSHPAMIRMAKRLKPKDKFVLVTDSMEATGMPDGTYAIAGQPVTVSHGRAFTSDGKLAGSTLSLWEGVKNLMKFCNIPLEEAIPCATENPARMMGIYATYGSLAPEKKCHLIVLDQSVSPSITAVYLNGHLIL